MVKKAKLTGTASGTTSLKTLAKKVFEKKAARGELKKVLLVPPAQPPAPPQPPLKIDDLKNVRLYVATPMYGGMAAGFYMQSLLRMQQVCSQLQITTSMSFMFNESLITRARNALANGFMNTDFTHLMFIDADIRFQAEEIPWMLQWDCDVICGIYPKKEINWGAVHQAVMQGTPASELNTKTGSIVVNLKNYAGQVTVPMGIPCEIFNGGTGFMIIKRRVFEEMAKKVPTYTNDVIDTAGTMKPDKITEYFATSIEEGTNRLLSEDYHFCKTWRDMGGKIHAAPWVHLAHLGSYLFEGQLQVGP